MRVVLRASLVGGGVRVNYDKRKNSLDRIVNFGIVITAVNDSAPCGSVAQLVEQRTENPRVSGSIPELGIVLFKKEYGVLAQSVEHLTFNQVVRGSNPRCLIAKSLDLQGFQRIKALRE